MREDICSIPINDVFLPRDGCPFCRMRDMLEERMATYITGAAMMEPDVRVETNRQGFCEEHFNQILSRGSRLSIALILESLLHEVEGEVFPEGRYSGKKLSAALEGRKAACFVCANIDGNMERLTANTVRLWQTDEEFRRLYREQTHLCLRHYGAALKIAEKKLSRREFPAFYEDSRKLAQDYLHTLSGDVSHFCKMYDYRSAGGDWGNSRDAIERSIRWLTSREPRQKTEEKNL